MPEYRDLPYVTKLVVAHLAAQSVADGAVGTEIPRNWQPGKLVRVYRVGGAEVIAGYLERANIQLDCFGAHEEESFRVAQAARRAMELATTVEHAEGVVTAVSAYLGPVWQPEPVTGRSRHLLGLQVTVRARSAASG